MSNDIKNLTTDLGTYIAQKLILALTERITDNIDDILNQPVIAFLDPKFKQHYLDNMDLTEAIKKAIDEYDSY